VQWCWEVAPTSERIVDDFLRLDRVLTKIVENAGVALLDKIYRSGRRAQRCEVTARCRAGHAATLASRLWSPTRYTLQLPMCPASTNPVASEGLMTHVPGCRLQAASLGQGIASRGISQEPGRGIQHTCY
jgi:hypothetical protein